MGNLYLKNIMQIYSTRQLKELQADFKRSFPYLKIEFFSQPHEIGEESDEAHLLNNCLTIGELTDQKTKGCLALNSDLQVGLFEKEMEQSFGLYIQVYRKSHGKWLQTWATDIWTLGEQNHRSKVLGNIDDHLGKES